MCGAGHIYQGHSSFDVSPFPPLACVEALTDSLSGGFNRTTVPVLAGRLQTGQYFLLTTESFLRPLGVQHFYDAFAMLYPSSA